MLTPAHSSQPMVHSLLGKDDDTQDQVPSVPQPVLDRISAKQGDEAVAEALVGVPQKSASLKIDLLNQSILFNILREEGEVRGIARLKSLGLPHAGDWLSVVPQPALGLHLRPPEFVPALKAQMAL